MNSFTSKEAAARALEARLREISKHARNFYDQPVRQLRTRLRDAYADVLLEDPVLAQVRSCLKRMQNVMCLRKPANFVPLQGEHVKFTKWPAGA